MKALITGGAAGLGRALVEECQRLGMAVVAVDREAPAKPFTVGVELVLADLGAMSDFADLQKALARHGSFDLAIMNAGINATGRFEQIDLPVLEAVIEVNLVAPILLSRFLIAGQMIPRGGGIVFVSSLSHFVGYPGAAVYAGTKDGLAIFAKSLRRPLKRLGINVLTVLPGPLDTDHAKRHAPPGSKEGHRDDPARIARLIVANRRRSGVLVPGFMAKVYALAGRFARATATALMRRLIFEKFPQ